MSNNAESDEESRQHTRMKLLSYMHTTMITFKSSGIVNGIIDPRFGKFSTDKKDGVPTRSLPLQWENIPEGTQSLALVMQDYDAIPVCGFSWIHWLVANIDPKSSEVKENASRENTDLVQGKNSLASKQICGELSDELTNFYSGPRPPDQDHEYEIKIYALDCQLELSEGFRFNELIKAMKGHILDEGVLHGIYMHQEK